MNFQPASFNSVLQAGAVFRGRALVAEQERAIELFDIDATILDRFEGVRVLQEASGSLLRFGASFAVAAVTASV